MIFTAKTALGQIDPKEHRLKIQNHVKCLFTQLLWYMEKSLNVKPENEVKH